MPFHPVTRRSSLLLALLLLAALLPGQPAIPNARAFSNGRAASLVLGQPSFTLNGWASPTRFYRPRGIVVDPVSGAVFVADRNNSRVLRFNSVASLNNGAAAEGVLGQPDLYSRRPITSRQGMNYATALAIDNNGTLWVGDTFNNRVLRFDNAASKPNGAPADAVLGQPDFTSNTPATTAQGLRVNYGIALDTHGRLWVSDHLNHRVLRFDNAASKPNGAPADGVLGQPDFTSNTPATTAEGIREPVGITVDSSGTLWLADYRNHRVLRFDNAASKPNGAPADGVLGQPDFTSNTPTSTAQGMEQPYGVMVDRAGRLWVSDSLNHRVLRFENAASKPNGAAADGLLGCTFFAKCGGFPTQENLWNPAGITSTPDGRIWVAVSGHDRVLRFDNAASKPNGPPSDSLLGLPSFSIIWRIAPDETRIPAGVAIDPTTKKVFVADSSNHRILRYASLAYLNDGAPAEGTLGATGLSNNHYVYGPGPQSLFYPWGIAIDRNGTLWVADRDNNRVLRFDNAASKPDGAPADGVLGQPNFGSNTAGTTAQTMSKPYAVAVDGNGVLWVADANNHRVLRFDNAAAKPNGASADAVLGQPDLSSNTARVTAQGMYSPQGLMVDGGGRLWVADAGNSRVLRFDNAATKSNGAATDAVLGQTNFTSNGAATTAQKMAYPAGLALDSTGTLWVADKGNHRVLGFDNVLGKANGAAADTVLGQPDFTSNTPTTSAQGMWEPFGLAVDADDRLWVADHQNNRVLLFGERPPPPVRVRIPDQSDAAGQIVRVPIVVDQPVIGMLAASLTIAFDSAVLRPHGAVAVPGALTPNWSVTANTDTPGQLRLVLLAPGTPASGAGALAELEFEVVGSIGASTTLAIAALALNGGDIAALGQTGRFTVAAGYQLAVRTVRATTGDPLSSTTVQAIGPASTSCVTSSGGACTLPALSAGSYNLALSKRDDVAGISAYDAALILQHDVGRRTLEGPALAAGDTSGNSQVSAYDAALVIQHVAGLRSLPFPAGSVWKFAPPSPLAVSASQRITVTGVLLGDVSGHLTPASARLRSAASQPAGALQLIHRSIPNAHGFRTAELWLRPRGAELLSLEATLGFDPTLVQDIQVIAGPATGALFASQTGSPGRLRLALARAEALPETLIATLRYRASAAGGFGLERAETNQGGRPVWLPPAAQDWRLHIPSVLR